MDRKKAYTDSAPCSTDNSVDPDGVERQQVELNIINKLICSDDAGLSLHKICNHALSLVLSHPFFSKNPAAIWHVKDEKAKIIAKRNLSQEIQNAFEEPLRTIKNKGSSITISLSKNKAELNRINVSLDTNKEEHLCISLWVTLSKPKITAVSDFLTCFTKILNLLFAKIEQDKKEKIFKNVLNETMSAVEISDIKAINYFVNSAIKKINPCGSTQAFDSTFLNLLQTAPEYHPYFDNIPQQINSRKTEEQQIRLLAYAIKQSPVLIMITDTSGYIEYSSNKLTDLTGYTSEEIDGKNANIFNSQMIDTNIFNSLWETLRSGSEWRGELLNKNKQGDLFWVSAIISPLRDESGEINHYLAIMEDITHKKIYDEILKHQATYDNMTNIPNRLSGHTNLEKSIIAARKNKSKLAVLFLDVDNFKSINDTLGHAAGDKLLQILASRLLDSIRHNDSIARIGGDEFMVILDNIQHQKDAKQIAQKCLNASNKPFKIRPNTINVTSSVGIALFPTHGINTKQLMRHADRAMYEAKESGKNKLKIYTNSMSDMVVNNTHLKTELKNAIRQKEFSLYYQPLIDVNSNQVIGAEAFLRWHSKSIGTIYPYQIIPIAEETGDIIALGEWILHTACHQAREWQKSTQRPLKISVNLSILQLKSPEFISQLQSALDSSGLSPYDLILELTESSLIDDSPLIFDQLKKISDMNVECSIDNFCIGYSSLSYLSSYPFKSIKIDKSFIHDIHTSENELHLIHNIITLSRQLKLKIFAEGVETANQLKLIRSLNCDYVQGWYFTKAMNDEHFIEWLKSC